MKKEISNKFIINFTHDYFKHYPRNALKILQYVLKDTNKVYPVRDFIKITKVKSGQNIGGTMSIFYKDKLLIKAGMISKFDNKRLNRAMQTWMVNKKVISNNDIKLINKILKDFYL